MVVVTDFLSILNQVEFFLVQNRKENCHHDIIPFNVKGNGNIVFSVQRMQFCVVIVYSNPTTELKLFNKICLHWISLLKLVFKTALYKIYYSMTIFWKYQVYTQKKFPTNGKSTLLSFLIFQNIAPKLQKEGKSNNL